MYSRPMLHGNPRQRILAAVPLAVFLIILSVGTWAGRNQLKGAIEASGAFVAAQLGQPKPAGRSAAAAPVVLQTAKPKATPSTKPEVKREAKPEVKREAKPEVKREAKPEVKQPAKQEVKQAPKQESKPEAKQEAKQEAKPEAKPKATEGDFGLGDTSTGTDAFGVKGKAADAPKVIVEITDKGRKLKILDVPIPADCHPIQHADYAGDAVVWGLGHKKASAAACCAACKEHQRQNPDNRPCNVWVWCGDPSGICWTMDIHNHTTGDCWLKHQAKWDNNPDLSLSNLEVNHMDRFSEEFRKTHKTSPEFVPWTAGVVPQELSW